MKKNLLIFSLLAIVAVSVFAQTHKRHDKIKDRIQDELNITEAKADSVANVVQRFLANTKNIRTDTALNDESRKTALTNERRQQVAVLKTFLTTQQIKKLQTLLRNYKSRKAENENEADTSLKKYYF